MTEPKLILVRDWMTPNPVTIGPKSRLPQARKLMQDKHIRRLLVVDEGRVIGIVTRGDIREAQPPDASQLTMYELNYHTTTITLEKIMSRDPIKVSPDAPIAEAARLMLEYKVGGLPVCEGTKLVGIITDSDLFRMILHEMSPGLVAA